MPPSSSFGIIISCSSPRRLPITCRPAVITGRRIPSPRRLWRPWKPRISGEWWIRSTVPGKHFQICSNPIWTSGAMPNTKLGIPFAQYFPALKTFCMARLTFFLFLAFSISRVVAQTQSSSLALPAQSGNPIFPGWYADPEAALFDTAYWVFPTFSDKYNKQVFFDAFSSPDLVQWYKHPHIVDTAIIQWAKRAMWAPAIAQKGGKYYFFFA